MTPFAIPSFKRTYKIIYSLILSNIGCFPPFTKFAKISKILIKRVAEGDASNPHDFTAEISALDKSKISIFVYVNLLPLQTRMA